MTDRTFKVNIKGKEIVEYDLYLKAPSEEVAKEILMKDFFNTEYFEVASMDIVDVTDLFNDNPNSSKVLN